MAVSVAEVKAALDDGDEAVRLAAISRLDVQQTGALGLLVRAMADVSWRVRREAVERAGAGEVPRGVLVPALVPVLAEAEDVGLRNAAIEVVVGLGVAALPLLHAALARRPAHCKVLCDVLGRIGDASSAVALVPMLSDEDPNVRIAAAEAIGRLQHASDPAVDRAVRSAVGAIAARAGGGERALLGSALLEAMAKRGIELEAETLRVLLEEPILAAAALRALAGGAAPRSPEARAAILTLAAPQLDVSVRTTRESAILALARLAREGSAVQLGAGALAATTEALLEGTVEVQRAAATLLGASGSGEVARALLVAIDDPALAESGEAALIEIARRNADALVATAATVTPTARAAAYRAIGAAGAGGGRVLAALVAATSVEEEGVVVAAVEAIGGIGDPAGAVALAEIMDAAEAEGGAAAFDRIEAARRALRALAARAPDAVLAVARSRSAAPFVLLVGQLGSADDAERLTGVVSDEDPGARAAAAAALAELAGRASLTLPAKVLRAASEAVRVASVDESAVVRAAAVRAVALVELRRPEHLGPAVEGIIVAARDGDARVRGAAVRALAEVLRDERGASAKTAIAAALRALADGSDVLTAVPALETVARELDPADDPRLLDALTGTDAERRKVALHALAQRPRLLVRGDLVRVAERALHDARWDLRRAATAALAATGAVGRAALVARQQIETDPLVRSDLSRALGDERVG